MGFGSIAPYYDPMTGLPIGAPETDVATVPPVVVPKVPIVAPVEDWREREAQAGLALQQADKLKAERAAQTWGSLAREIPGNLLNMAKGLVAPALPADPNAPPSLGPAAFGTMSPGEAALQPETTGGRVVRGVGNMIAEGAKSGFTAPHDAAAGDILEWTPEGHTSPAMVHRGFDTAALAGGASAGGTAERLASSPGLDFRVAGKQLASDSGKPGAAVAAAERSYPMAPRDNWYGSANYETAGGKMEKMSPDDFLAQSRPMKMDELTRENVDDLKRHIESGGELDPLQLYGNGKEDGRHRAIAAKELGIKELPVINFRSDTAKPGAAISALEHAPPFYSHLEQAVTEVPMKKATGEQWLGTLSNKGVKPAEVEHTGLQTFLKEKGSQPVTKEEVAAHVGENKLQLGEVNKGGGDVEVLARKLADEENGPGSWDRIGGGGQEHYWRDARKELGAKFEGYQLPGGENYREKLLTLPEKGRSVKDAAADRVHEISTRMEQIQNEFDAVDRAPETPDLAAKRLALYNEKTALNKEWQEQHSIATAEDTSKYKSSHWDEPNVLVHRRTNERDVGGVPSLHVEELQSDWHQAGRKQGYGENLKPGWQIKEMETPGDFSLHGPEDARYPVATGSKEKVMEAAKQFGGMDRGVPDAPFKKTEAWTTLGLKDAIREAAEKGIDRISITPGEAQAARYDISKQVGSINYNPETKHLVVTRAGPGGRSPLIYDQPAEAAKLPDMIGKEAAEKLLQQPKTQGGYHNLEGEGLRVGGEGMKGFYDKMVPDALNKIGKPHGVKVQSGTAGSHYSLVDKEGKPGQSFANKAEADAFFAKNPQAAEHWDLKKDEHPVHYMDIPPSLKEQALKKGFSLFEDTGPTATALAVAERAGYVNPHEAAAAARGAEAPLRGGGGARGVEEAQAAAARHAGAVEPLAGLPSKPLTVGGESYVPGPIGRVHDVAKDYMASTGRTYERADRYHPIDTEHSTAIAKAFDEMKHEPDNPKVKASYDAMVNETKDQYNELKKSGIKIEAIPPGAPDPYAETPRLAAKDVAENNHLWFFPTESGFGTNPSGHDMAAHPLMRASGETLNGKPLLNNDLFRIVHDYFGHLKEGHGFRAAGEDNAWRTHAKMYSDEARPAMTTETRGQNSWVNYGPHGETNRTASAADTHFADQKVGLLPEWTMRDRNAHGFGELDSHPNERALTVNDILSPETPKMEPRSRDVETIAKELMDRGSSALEKMGVEGGRIEKSAPHTDELLSRGIASEIKAALGRGNTASDWYTKKISEAMDTATEMHPELKDNPHQKMAFTSALAITSQGEAVTSNVRLANQVYQHFKDTGRFPDKIDAKKGPSMVSNFHKMNALLDELGPEGTREFLHKEFTVKELEKAGYDVGGENKQAKVYGSSILGPKIGQGFYQNLNGNYKPVTMDLWFMRAWGRMTGTLVGKTDMSPQIARLQDAMKAEGMKVPKDPEGLAAAAREAVQKHERDYRTNQADYKSGKKSKSELTYAAERYEKNATGINEQPTSGSQRQWMRDVVNRSREILADHGHKVTNADLQAIWWYPEKELYSKLGGRDSDKINIDYATAFRDLKARSGGVVPEPAAAVVPPPSGGRPADKADVSRASAGSGKGSKKATRQKVSSFGSLAPGMVG